MSLLAGLLTGVFVYLVVGAASGNLPTFGERWGRPSPQISQRQLWLIQAGAELTPRQFLVGSIGAGLVTFSLLVAVIRLPAVAIVPAIIVTLLPRAYFARRRAARLREVSEAWPEGIRDLLTGISAGLSLNQAITGLATSGPEPLQLAFARYPLLARMLGVVPALEVIKEELADPTSDRVIEVLILAHERGGHILSDILRDLADATAKDVRAYEQIATDALEQKINARAVFALPWLVLVVLAVQEDFRQFYESKAGLVVVLVGAALSLLGMWIVGRLSRDPVEERVFGAAAPLSEKEGRR
ncbi:MAG: type II secretion system F family protein [Actinomycetota bacterium]|nr:type II secretion system F family protein [Actinomycetota bacterium]